MYSYFKSLFTSDFLALFTGMLTLIITFFLFLMPAWVGDAREGRESVYLEINDRRIALLEIKIKKIDKQLAGTKAQLSKITKIDDNTKSALQLAELRSQIDYIQNQFKIIETAIVENPVRAMSLPILRRDIDALGSDLRGDLVATGKAVDRIYDLNKWFIGLMATMALAVLSLAAGNLFKKKE